MLPRKAAEASAELSRHGKPGPSLKLRNRGIEVSDYEVFSLTGQSTKIPKSEIPGPGYNQAVIDMRSVGVRHLPGALGTGDVLEFAINTNGRRAHPNYPAEFDVEIDANGDGTPDYLVYNAENGGFAATGQNLVYVADLGTGTARAFFYTDADLNSGNVIFSVPMNYPGGGITVAAGATIGFSVYAFDNYFTGANTDAIEGMRFTPGVEKLIHRISFLGKQCIDVVICGANIYNVIIDKWRTGNGSLGSKLPAQSPCPILKTIQSAIHRSTIQGILVDHRRTIHLVFCAEAPGSLDVLASTA